MVALAKSSAFFTVFLRHFIDMLTIEKCTLSSCTFFLEFFSNTFEGHVVLVLVLVLAFAFGFFLVLLF